jgi:hypothetical protein
MEGPHARDLQRSTFLVNASAGLPSLTCVKQLLSDTDSGSLIGSWGLSSLYGCRTPIAYLP